MLITIGEYRSSAVDRRLACTLAAIAGGVNTVAFHAVGFFSANMTGNVSALSERLAGGRWLSGAFYLTIVICFVAGASAAVLFINSGKRRQVHGVYAWSILVEAGLMGALALTEWWRPHSEADPCLVLGLSFLMGLQNAVVTRISDARVRATHISGMATDIGIELAMLIDVARGREPLTDAPTNWSRLRLHFQTIIAFLAGGAVGVLLYGIVSQGLLLIAAALLMGVGLVGVCRANNLSATQIPV